MLLALACTKGATPRPSDAAADRARAALQGQLEMIRTRASQMGAAFAPDAIVLAPGGTHAEDVDALSAARVTPHDTVEDVAIARQVTGGTDEVVWTLAELTITKRQHEPETTPERKIEVIRTVQLLAAAAAWKPVAASFGEERTLARMKKAAPMPGGTRAGPLAALLGSPGEIAGALAADPAVIIAGPGRDEVAIGPGAARAQLDRWRAWRLSIAGIPREVRTARWGFVQAMVDLDEPGGPPFRLSGQLFALAGPEGTWSVVAVHYLPL